MFWVTAAPDRTFRRPIALFLAPAVLLAGCSLGIGSGGEEQPAPGSDTDEQAAQSSDASESPTVAAGPEDPVQETSLSGIDGDVTATVYPVARTEGHAVVTLDLETTGEEAISLHSFFGAVASPPIHPPGAIRLFDPTSGDVHTPAVDERSDVIGNGGWHQVGPDGTRIQIVFAPPEADSIALLLPGSAMIPEVPVIDDTPPEAPAYDALGDVVGESYQASPPSDLPVFAAGTYARELDGAVSTLNEPESLEVTLEADFLFDSDSAELQDGSERILDRAAEVIQTRAAKNVQVIGHTDNVASDAHNQDLSERRADAVADALASRLDTDAHPIETEGRSFHEPVASNDTDEGKALNRRVTITIEAPQEQQTAAQAQGELPEFEDGPTGTGADGVEVSLSGESWHVSAPSARRTGQFMVVDLHVTSTADEASPSFLSGVWSHRGHDSSYPMTAASGVSVVSGTTQLFPADYQYGTTDADTGLWATVSDLETSGSLADGQTRVFSIVYPALEDEEVITLQLDESLGTMPFRLTGIPVE